MRTWTLRTPEMEPLVEVGIFAKWCPADLKGKKEFRAHLIGFRGIGSELGDPFFFTKREDALRARAFVPAWDPPDRGESIRAAQLEVAGTVPNTATFPTDDYKLCAPWHCASSAMARRSRCSPTAASASRNGFTRHNLKRSRPP